MSDNRKYMNVKEFRERGYLQEVNRRLLHPLGLALEVVIEDDGTEHLGGVWDSREDTEGIIYGGENPDRLSKSNFIDAEIEHRRPARENSLGYWIQELKRTPPSPAGTRRVVPMASEG